MNFTFLIGNGFDLNLNLPTSYSDFYTYLQKINPEEVSDDLHNLIDEIKVNGEYWSDMELALGTYPERTAITVPEIFLDQGEALNNALRSYLQTVQLHYSLEMISNTNTNEFHNHLLNFNDDFTEEQKQWITGLKNRYTEHINFQFIDFNYTSYLDEIYQWAGGDIVIENRNVRGSTYQSHIKAPLHIHGTLKDGLIVGVDNTEQINGTQDFVESIAPFLIKHDLINTLGTLNIQKAKKIISESRIVCVYGMSFGLTDLSWWLNIWEWLKAHEDNRLVIFSHSRDKMLSTAIEKARYWRKVQDKFLNVVSAVEEERSQYRQKIFVCVNSNVFTFKKIKVVKKNGET